MAATRALVDARHLARQSAIRVVTGDRLAFMLRALPDLEQESVDRYVAGAYPTVLGGQRVAADTAAAYTTVLAGSRRRVGARPVNVDAALARSGVLVAADSRSLVAPVLRARHLAAEGATTREALAGATGYARQLSGGDLQAAMRVGSSEGADAADLQVTGWRKALSPEACDWCADIADNVYDSPEDIPFHDGDRCGAEPDLGEREPARFDDSDIPF
jgi:hypothetical protein